MFYSFFSRKLSTVVARLLSTKEPRGSGALSSWTATRNSVFLLWTIGLALGGGCGKNSTNGSPEDSGTEVDSGDTGNVKETDGPDSSSSQDTDSQDGLKPQDPEMTWVKVPAGTFTFGSDPSLTSCRGKYTEKQVEVTLTRPFLMAETEVTQKQWSALGFSNPSDMPREDGHPVNLIDFYEAAAWCNALSKLEKLETCYDLSCCSGEVAVGCPDGEERCGDPEVNFNCNCEVHKYPVYYDCPGYRLPTTAEWEYAAKAGTDTLTYNGNTTVGSDGCEQEPVLDGIAWYCHNSDDRTHQVKGKKPNDFGIYDMLGNVGEWVDYITDGNALDVYCDRPGGPLVDPVGLKEGTNYDMRGGWFSRDGCHVTTSWQHPVRPYRKSHRYGFRPVKTVH